MVQYQMTGWDHVIAGLICFVAPALAVASRRFRTEDLQLSGEEKIRLYHSNALLLTIFALIIFTVWRIPGRTVSGLGFVWPQWNWMVTVLIILVFLFYVLDLFFQYGIRKWRHKTLSKRESSLSFVPSDRKEWFHFVFLALAAGIGEEIIFRGYLIHYLLHWTGNTQTGLVIACGFSSALFAFLHGYQGWLSMIKIFFLAVLFALIIVISQSLIVVMVLHALIDLMSGWLGIYLGRMEPENESASEDRPV